MSSLIYAWTNGCANNGDASDLRRHRAHYDVIVMHWWFVHTKVSLMCCLMLYLLSTLTKCVGTVRAFDDLRQHGKHATLLKWVITVTSYWLPWRLKSPALNCLIEETTKASVTGPLWGEFPIKRASNTEKFCILWRHHITCLLYVKYSTHNIIHTTML